MQKFKKYVGVKIVNATPMSSFEAGTFLNRPISVENAEAPDYPGYLVEYPDGYKAWCPKKQFEEANRPCDNMSFGHAIEALKKGHRVCRAGWNGKGMWLAYMSGMTLPPFSTQGTDRKVNDRTAKFIGENTPLETLPYIAMWTADKKWLPGWLASQTDMLSDDWQIVE